MLNSRSALYPYRFCPLCCAGTAGQYSSCSKIPLCYVSIPDASLGSSEATLKRSMETFLSIQLFKKKCEVFEIGFTLRVRRVGPLINFKKNINSLKFKSDLYSKDHQQCAKCHHEQGF